MTQSRARGRRAPSCFSVRAAGSISSILVSIAGRTRTSRTTWRASADGAALRGGTSPSLSLSTVLLVLQIREQDEVLTARQALRELLHDASEGLRGWDPIGPLKDHLGEPFRKLEQRLQALVGERYGLAGVGRRRLPPAQGGRSSRRVL